MVEQFLGRGYAVVFLHRRGSAHPFVRRLGKPEDLLARLTAGTGTEELSQLKLELDALAEAAAAAECRDRLLTIPFTTIFEYLDMLETCSLGLAPAASRAIIVLAAAVSDFFLPMERMSANKIQSTQRGMVMELDNVPKMLGRIKLGSHGGKDADEAASSFRPWAPDAVVVSFKLETNQHILEAKAVKAMLSYGVDLVVANNLADYTERVTVVGRVDGQVPKVHQSGVIDGEASEPIPVSGVVTTALTRDGNSAGIEALLVQHLAAYHERARGRAE